jgi:acetyltransferase-like isoleucine patch superfamily enzyme
MNKEILKHDYSLIRIYRKFLFFIASKFPFIPGKIRAIIFKKGGVNFVNAKSCFIGYNVYFDDLHPELISVGEGTIITEGTRILSHFLDTAYIDFDHQYLGKVSIGSKVFIGMNVIVVKPVNIGDGAVIGANSVITKDILPYTIWGGNPAKFIKERIISNSYK